MEALPPSPDCILFGSHPFIVLVASSSSSATTPESEEDMEEEENHEEDPDNIVISSDSDESDEALFFGVVLRRVCRQLAVFEGSSFILVNALFSPFCNQEVLSLSDSCVGSDIYRETLAKALAKHFGARLLIVDSLSLPGGTPSKEVDSAKESSKPERPSVLAKRSTHAASLKHSKPASSVDAEIVGGSTISSQAMLKQEVSTASSKGTTIKTGDRVKFVGNFPSAVSSIQNHPSRLQLMLQTMTG
ncbi:uncharacterized protein [Arachis hypogaea]|uniref:uncharacterized protein n=1 Tax=Arachis hypogaea TaxID=3818 RepID=UPI003B228241